MYPYATQPAITYPMPRHHTPAPAPGIAVTGLVLSIIIFTLALAGSIITIPFSILVAAEATASYNNYSNGELVAMSIVAFLPLGTSGILGAACSIAPHLSMGSPEFRGSGVKISSTVFLFLHLAFLLGGILFGVLPLLALS